MKWLTSCKCVLSLHSRWKCNPYEIYRSEGKTYVYILNATLGKCSLFESQWTRPLIQRRSYYVLWYRSVNFQGAQVPLEEEVQLGNGTLRMYPIWNSPRLRLSVLACVVSLRNHYCELFSSHFQTPHWSCNIEVSRNGRPLIVLCAYQHLLVVKEQRYLPMSWMSSVIFRTQVNMILR